MSSKGPGYATPLEAMQTGPREEILYVACIQPDESKFDVIATVDVDPQSPTYCQVIHRLHTGYSADGLHHMGWNVCSSCHNVKSGCKIPVRSKLIVPAVMSDRIYVVDTGKNPRAPSMYKVIDSSEMHALNCATPTSAHCLASGEIMIAIMGDVKGNPRGNFVLVDAETYKIKDVWNKGPEPKFNHDFWYQPHFDIMVATDAITPQNLKSGFELTNLSPETFGKSLNLFSWKKRELIQTLDLGDNGLTPLEIRFLHDPKKPIGFVACGLSSSIFRIYQNDSKWDAEKIIQVPPKKVQGWELDFMPSLVTDFLISLDDKYLYFSNWFHGDVRQYDISDVNNPKLTGQIFLGGLILSDSNVQVLEDEELTSQPDPVYIKGRRLWGAPQMMQLSLDGKRLYVSTDVCLAWDKQFYPDVVKYGGHIAKLDIDVENGGMTLDKNFLVHFSDGPDGPLLPHQIRYPGGDCTSDIWLADD